MIPKIARTQLVDRNYQHRDLWLCILATEGADTEPGYFSDLQARGLISRTRVRLLTLPTRSTQGDGPDPRHVLSRLIEFQEQTQLGPDDQLWLVLDIDHHERGAHKENFVDAIRDARQRGYRLAISNPCFEVWLLLHFKTGQEVTALAVTSKACKQSLAQIRAENEKSYEAGLYSSTSIDTALSRAAALDRGREPWPSSTGTHVYQLVRLLPRR